MKLLSNFRISNGRTSMLMENVTLLFLLFHWWFWDLSSDLVSSCTRDLVTSCDFIDSSILANEVAPKTERMLLYVSLSSQTGLTEQGLTQALAERLDQSFTDFVIASFDSKLDVSCQQKSDPAWSVSSADYFIVHWTLT